MFARMFIFLGFSFLAKPSCDSRTTDARRSLERREAVDGNKCSQFHPRRTSCECLANVARMSRECRETFANDSCDNLTTFVRLSQICLNHLFGVTAMLLWLQCRYFCHQNVSQISLEIVANCSHHSEILA